MRTQSPPSPGELVSLLGPPILVMGMIFLLSAQPDEGGDKALWEILLRKLAHITEYAVLAYVWWRALSGLAPGAKPGVALVGAAALSLLYAVSDEFHQTFVDGRNGTPVDVLIDAIGISVACAVAYARRRRRTVGASRPRAA